jgi:hypothetical protein
MNSDIKAHGVDPQVLADIEALVQHHMEGTPIDPELARRVEERADRITQDLARRNVQIDVDGLLREVRNDE